MKKILSKIALGAVCLSSFAAVSYADSVDMVVHNLINSPSNASHDSHWGNQIPAWQLGKMNWGMVAAGCAPETVCVMGVFAEVTSAHPRHVADVTVDLTNGGEIVDVVNMSHEYKVCKAADDNTEAFLVRDGSFEFKKFC